MSLAWLGLRRVKREVNGRKSGRAGSGAYKCEKGRNKESFLRGIAKEVKRCEE